MVQLRWGAECVKGNFRENNEDAFAVQPEAGVFLVADGMGGQNAGERASHMAAELIPQKLELALEKSPADDKVPDGIDNAIRDVNKEIITVGKKEAECRNMGTTVVLLVSFNDQLFIGGIGDSRVYQFRSSTLTQLTSDHTLTNELVKAGTISEEEAKTHRYQNVLHRYLGSPAADDGAEVTVISPEVGDRYLLCSDGVTGGVEDEEIASYLSDFPDPQDVAQRLVAAAESGGSKDNITCIVVDVVGS